MDKMGYKFHVNQAFFGYDINLTETMRDGTVNIAKNIEMQTLTPGEICMYPTALLTIKPEAAVGLMDALWRAGIRPSDGEGSVGQIGAVKDHLADMQKIVFGHLLKEKQCSTQRYE